MTHAVMQRWEDMNGFLVTSKHVKNDRNPRNPRNHIFPLLNISIPQHSCMQQKISALATKL